MKKIFLLTVLLFQLTFVFGQKDWGSWSTNSCYKGIQYRCKLNDYNSSAKQYTWDVEIRNNYSIKVSLNFDITNSSIDGRTTIAPASVDKSWTLNASNVELFLSISKVCFHHPNGFDQCSEYNNKGYASFAECDNGSPKYTIWDGNKNTNSNSSSNNSTNSTTQQTQPQNDLTEYNRSKAEMEQKLADKNADIQRQNQDNANKNNIWNNAVKVGVDAHNSGNYTEAKNQFTIAVNNSTNEQNRQNAQNYYDTSVEAEKSQAKIKMTSDLVQARITSAYGIADAIKANRERKEQRDAETKAWIAKKRIEKLAAKEEEKLQFAKLLTDAENGDFSSQLKIARSFNSNYKGENFLSSLYFYRMAYNNPNRELSESFLIEYTDKLQYFRKVIDLENIFLDEKLVEQYPRIKLKSTFYLIFRDFIPLNGDNEYFLKIGINQLKDIVNLKQDELAELLFAYMQTTGKYEQYGIVQNSKDGFNLLKKSKNIFAKFYLGLIYLNGCPSIEQNIEKAKDNFRECAGIKKKYNSYPSEYFRYAKTESANFTYSIYSPKILSLLEITKLSKNERLENGTIFPNQIFFEFHPSNTSFIPEKEMGFIFQYVQTIAGMRNCNFEDLIPNAEDFFNLAHFDDSNETISIVLLNFSLEKCQPCQTQYSILKKINNVNFFTIQVATDFDLTKEQQNDVFYFEGGEKVTTTETGSGTSSSFQSRKKISNDYVFYTNSKEFDVTQLKEQNNFPAMYFYKGNKLKFVKTGLSEEKTINEIIQKIK